MPPKMLADLFAEGQCPVYSEQVQAESNQHEVGKKIQDGAHRPLSGQGNARFADAAGNSAG